MSKASKLPPRTEGYYLFHGTRHIRNAMYEHLSEPLQVVEHYNARGNVTELAVCMLGRASRFPLSAFAGTWQVLDMGSDYAELEAHWPSLEDCEDGVDVFAQYPIAGLPACDQ